MCRVPASFISVSWTKSGRLFKLSLLHRYGRYVSEAPKHRPRLYRYNLDLVSSSYARLKLSIVRRNKMEMSEYLPGRSVTIRTNVCNIVRGCRLGLERPV